jgi:hypothetical protein
LISNVIDIVAYNIISSIRSLDIGWTIVHEKRWQVYLFFSDFSIDLLSMMNTLSMFIIFLQIYKVTHFIPGELDLNSGSGNALYKIGTRADLN